MMTLKEAVEDLESGTTSEFDVQNKLVKAGIKLECDIKRVRSENCPLAKYFSLKTDRAVSVLLALCRYNYSEVGEEHIGLGKNTTNFRRMFDRQISP